MLEHDQPDFLVPIPLHPSKERSRGFNQSERIALGISAKTSIPVLCNHLTRIKKGRSQTRKGRWKRSENSESLFRLDLPKEYEKKHFALVDDVITTGATIEACGSLFQKYPECRLSVLSLAFTWS